MELRKARISDVREMQKLMLAYATNGEMLSRSLSELYECVRDFVVIEEGGKLLGTTALHVVWDGLAEVRSVAVAEGRTRQGIGGQMVEACIAEARAMGIQQLFCLTYKPAFFGKHGFRLVDRSTLPYKVWGDCIRCPKHPDCDENAMVLDL